MATDTWPKAIRERIAEYLTNNYTAADAVLAAIDWRARNPLPPTTTCFCGRFHMTENDEPLDGRLQFHSMDACHIKKFGKEAG
jgi:hypothetical protein